MFCTVTDQQPMPRLTSLHKLWKMRKRRFRWSLIGRKVIQGRRVPWPTLDAWTSLSKPTKPLYNSSQKMTNIKLVYRKFVRNRPHLGNFKKKSKKILKILIYSIVKLFWALLEVFKLLQTFQEVPKLFWTLSNVFEFLRSFSKVLEFFQTNRRFLNLL